MDVEFDLAKRALALQHRGLDMARVGEVLQGTHLTFADIRFEYGEERFVTVGFLDGRMVIFAWTLRGYACRVISLRKTNERETRKYQSRLDRPG